MDLNRQFFSNFMQLFFLTDYTGLFYHVENIGLSMLFKKLRILNVQWFKSKKWIEHKVESKQNYACVKCW